ncbi:thiamine pyrophosphate-binding protein [Microvirgula aerodenitrificans]|uniref:thiamine pyrophosphate-binding protein n=1 Tax=Microvirgula aerodenitrificans TaxID=57480 RepID=UPI002F41C1FE
MLKSFLMSGASQKREFDPVSQPGQPLRSLLAAATGSTETIASYLNKRLVEIGCKYVQAIPGDYIAPWVETLDDPGINEGLVRVHPNNEMLATYAADGYGRALSGQTVGCVAFTYGVGSLNAVQAMAGAYVENVPLVMINGTPSQAQFNSQRDQGVLWHHMFDGAHTDLRVLREVTAMAVSLDNPATAPDLIDAALTTCITESRPVYIEMAVGLQAYPCVAVDGRPPLRPSPLPQNAVSLLSAVNMVLASLQNAKKLVVIGGVEIARGGLQAQFVELLKALKAPYLSDLLGKSILSEYREDVQFSGVYNGRNSQQNVQDLVRSADMIFMLGVRETDFNFSGVASADYSPNSAAGLPLPLIGQIEARLGAVMINSFASPETEGELYWGDIQLGPFMEALTAAVKGLQPDGQLNGVATFPRLQGSPWEIPAPNTYPAGDQITWDSFKSLLHHQFLTALPEDQAPILLADTGLTFYSLNNVKVPESGYIAQLAWGAIGYAPGAVSGVKLALETRGIKRRVIAVCGDGAFAESANALGQLAELGQDCVVFVMANGVFAIEQFLVNVQAYATPPTVKFVDLAQVQQTSLWDWPSLARGFGGVGYEVVSNQQLQDVLATLRTSTPPPALPHGPCTGGTSGDGCPQFEHGGARPPSPSTFTLVAVRNVGRDLPSNTRWKLK